MPSPAEQLAEQRNWQTLASFVRLQGGTVGTVPRLIPDEVVKYYRTVLMDNDLTPANILEDFLEPAQRAVAAQFAITNWRNHLKAVQVRAETLPGVGALPTGDKTKFSTALVEMIGRLSVTIGGNTENMGGVISVAKTVIMEGEDTAMFALFHEFGHGVQLESDVPKSVKDALFTSTETGARFGELFADAFAALALRAIGRSTEQIRAGARGALADHGEDSDHPDWPTREGVINTALART